SRRSGWCGGTRTRPAASTTRRARGGRATAARSTRWRTWRPWAVRCNSCTALGSRRLAAIAAGGMLGAAARYGLTRAIGTPWATFWINVVGSFVLGALVLVVVSRPLLRPFLATGVIGAFTTFS